MRKFLLCLLSLAFNLSPAPAAADPLRITSGVFALDIEGDIFVFQGPGFALSTSEFLIFSTKVFPPQCVFCAEGEIVDWSFTTPGQQLLGRGDATIDGATATGVDFIGTMSISAVPTALPPSADGLDVDFVAPFAFNAVIRGVQAGQDLFVRQFVGSGLVRVDYELSGTPGLFVEDDDTVLYEFATPVPEPATLVLLTSGLAAAAASRRRRRQRMC
jgi:hypothetical protein